MNRETAVRADVVVIGAGAAGLATAIFAARVAPILNVQCLDGAKRIGGNRSSLRPFSIRLNNIARMNVNNQQGRLWLLAERNSDLETMYNDLSQIARDLGYESYPYKAQNWLPHMKLINMPENRSTQIKDPTFGAIKGITSTVRRFEWTVQKDTDRWELLDQFSFPE